VYARSKVVKLKLPTAHKITLPKAVNGFKLREKNIFPQKEYGVAFAYHNEKTPEVSMDYYIYPISEELTIEHAIYTEYKNVIKGVRALVERDGGILSILYVTVIDSNNQHVIKTTMNMQLNSGDYISELYLTSVKGHYIKLRVSYPEFQSKVHHLRKLSEETFNSLLAGTKFKSKKELKYSVSLNSNIFAAKDKSTMALAMTYGLTVQAVLADDLVGSFADFTQLYKKSIELAEAMLEQKFQGKTSDDKTIDLFAINKAGFIREFLWQTFARPYWHKPRNLKQQAYTDWLNGFAEQSFPVRPQGVSVLISRKK
jgi:hypothetical protein